MYGDGEPSETSMEAGGAEHASTSGSSGEALSKQAHDNPAFVGNATASTSRAEQQSSDARDGEARVNSAPEGPAFIPVQNDAGWVPLAFSPIMFQGNPELWNGTAGTFSTGAETFPPGIMPLGAFPPGIGATGTADGISIPQCVPVLFPVQMPLFLPSPPSNQPGQSGGFSPMVPFYGLPGMAAGAPAVFKFPVPMNVPMPTERNLSGATAGQQLADAGRAPPAVARGEVPLGRVGPMHLNEVPPVAQGEAPDQRRVVRRMDTLFPNGGSRSTEDDHAHGAASCAKIVALILQSDAIQLQRRLTFDFKVGIQLDLLLLLKLAVIVFVFNQDGSKDRLLLLLGLACVIYLYQTSSLAPLLRWLAERAQQFMTPPHHHAQPQPDARRARGPDAQAREAPGVEAANPAAEERAAEAVGEAPAEGANAQVPQGPFLAFVKEVQLLVVGFVTSLLPGFHPHAD